MCLPGRFWFGNSLISIFSIFLKEDDNPQNAYYKDGDKERTKESAATNHSQSKSERILFVVLKVQLSSQTPVTL